MKKPFLLIALAICLLSGCAGIRYQIGESTATFLSDNHKKNFELVRNSNELTVYKWVNGWSYDPPYFFYFRNNALYMVDRGTPAPDVIIQNRY